MGIESLIKREKLEEMEIGDYIPCRYTSLTSGQVGYFSELGTCNTNEIPIIGSATPDGLFNFIKVDKGLLIADRVIQHSISWDVLNSNRFIDGIVKNAVPKLTKNVPEITSSAVFSSTYAAWKAFDELTGEANRWLPTTYPEWVAYDFINPKKITSYMIESYATTDGSTAPRDFMLYGWNGIQWEVVDIRTNETNWGSGVIRRIYKISNPGYYTKYKLEITEDNGYGRCSISEIAFYENKLIRSLSGGVAYRDENNNKSLTDKGLGGWPIDNEWDKYIVNSDLDGKIIPGDDNIWNWSQSIYGWCKETPIINISSNSYRIVRGFVNSNHFTMGPCTNTSNAWGFRPVLEYVEQDSKQTNLWY